MKSFTINILEVNRSSWHRIIKNISRFMLLFIVLMIAVAILLSISHTTPEISVFVVGRTLVSTSTKLSISPKAVHQISTLIRPECNTITVKRVNRHIEHVKKLEERINIKNDELKVLKIENVRLSKQINRLKSCSQVISSHANETLISTDTAVDNVTDGNVCTQSLTQNSPLLEVGSLMHSCLNSKVSFRGFCRIISSLKQFGLYCGRYTPCSNTIINWLVRAGVGLLGSTTSSTTHSIDIMDHWIGKGKEKIFLVLRLPIDNYRSCVKNKTAIKLADVNVVHCEVVNKSNGEIVSTSLNTLYQKIGQPVAIISDKGSDIKKGIRLLNEKGSVVTTSINDISHHFANIIKNHYSQQDWFSSFYKLISDGNKGFSNSSIEHLKAPKQNTKGRFMNVKDQTQWYMNIIQQIKSSSVDRAHVNDLLTRIYATYPLLESYRKQITELHFVLELMANLMEILKKEGYHEITHQKCMEMIVLESSKIPKAVETRIIGWLEEQKNNYQLLMNNGWDTAMPISSDIIESLFSQFKMMEKRTPEGDPTRLVAILPLFAGNHSAKKLQDLLINTSHKQAIDWVKDNIPQSIHSKKRKLSKTSTDKKRAKNDNNIETVEKLKALKVRPYIAARAA